MTLGATFVLGVLLVVLVAMNWRSSHRLDPLERNLDQYGHLAREYRMLAEGMIRDGISLQSDRVLTLERARVLDGLGRANGYLSERTPQRLQRAAALLASTAQGEQARAQRALATRLLGDSAREELAEQQSLLDGLKRDSRRELQAALAIAAILPLLGAAFWALFRRCVLKPLGDLESQMGLLARKDFGTVDLARIDASLHPLFRSYNRLVGRMQDLEAAHVKREAVLREELQRTTRALVEQQSVLARADRLAVLGDLAARMAHRLRSPLSAVLMNLTNLREETGSLAQKERLGRAIEAVERSLRELTALLDEAQQEPEAAIRVDLRRVVDDLFLLLGHQAQGRKIELHNAVPTGLVCRLPEAATRHALMNLLLNAVEADQWPAGRRVRVDAEGVKEGVRITVNDNRTGFSETELRVGLPGMSPWSRRGGALGLAIARRFVDHLGGTLVLENPSGGGARATLTIPQVETDG